jgi:hypothetical protein
VGAAICKNKGVGSPGVGPAHVKRIGGVRAEFPGGVQAVKFVVLADSSGGVGIVVCEALVDAAVVDNGLQSVLQQTLQAALGARTLAGVAAAALRACSAWRSASAACGVTLTETERALHGAGTRPPL